MEAYCLKCKEKREIINPIAGFTSNARPITSGTCAVCGSKLSKLGATPAHEGLEKPEVSKSAPKVKSAKAKTTKKAKTIKVVKKPTENRKTNGKATVLKPVVVGNGKELVIVESPAKARTIGKFLGDKYRVIASVGHVRDLLKSQLSVDVENGFTPKYRIDNEKKAIVAQIKDYAARSKKVFIATDPDREGEAIAWHVMESAEIDPAKSERVVFHEITREAIADAFAHTRQIDMDLVNAQQARRVLDRLVGFGISPILWAKVRGRLSAGRVQSVALRLVVEREREIQNFIPVEYWVVSADFKPDGKSAVYRAKLFKVNHKDPHLPNETITKSLVEDMRQAAYLLDSIKKATRKAKPSAPFITSTLQQEAARKLGFLTRKTMAVAQQLYEGIDTGNGETNGLITYMRTDSVHVSTQAIAEARGFIQRKFGNSYLPDSAPVYRTRAASAQEAHEAIRPTSVMREPEAVRAFLTNDQYRLYRLIWQRFVASQMESALIETVTVEVEGKSVKHVYTFRAQSSRTLFQGYRAVYEESSDDENGETNGFVDLPINDLREGQKQWPQDFITQQKFTQPPARFSEASLIQALEENKIGRPSTYSPIITTIQTRGYVSREEKRLVPTEIGFIVNDLVVEYFPSVVDIGFTSTMEDDLDKIAEGQSNWTEVMEEFYGPFSKSLEHAKENMPKTKIAPEKIGRVCPRDGGDLVLRTGKYGKFISCSNFPNCYYTEPLVVKTGVTCPKCKLGELVEKRSKKGRLFYGCNRFPECDFLTNNKPVTQACPNCGGLLTEMGKGRARCNDCHNVINLDSELKVED
ncbi:MAG: type I DNA topoisomerase [Anaerolineaceae bacterium]